MPASMTYFRYSTDIYWVPRSELNRFRFSSDRGTQYTSQEFDEYCRRHHIRRSLGRTGVCWDNAVAESFFATYKKELVHTRPWPNIDQLKTATFSWIESYYNRGRKALVNRVLDTNGI